MASIKKMDLNLLKTFDTLMDERSVSRAAERLSVTQPAVSGMLTRLRSSLDDPLFVRAQHGIIPTTRALELAPSIKKVLRDIEQIVEQKAFVPALSDMTLSIAATDYSLRAIIQPLLLALRELSPNMKLSVRWINDDQILGQMERGEVDLAFMTPDTAPPSLRAKPLFDESYVCVLGSSHPFAKLEALTLDQFCQLEHAIVSYLGGSFSGATDRGLEMLGRQRNVTLSVPSFLSLVDILSHSDLCAVVPSRLVRKSDPLKIMALPFAVTGFTKVLVWHERTHYNDAHKWVRNLLHNTCK